jgi:hypothetical protein
MGKAMKYWSRRTWDALFIAPALLVLASVFAVGFAKVHAQPPVTVCDVMAPDLEWKRCVSAQAAAALELRALTGKQYGDLLQELNAVKAELATRPTAQQVADTAWQKGLDAVGLFKRQTLSFEDPFLADYTRLRACQFGRANLLQPGSEFAVRCP